MERWQEGHEKIRMTSALWPPLTVIFIFLGFISLARSEQIDVIIHAVNYPPYEIENPGQDGLRGFDVEVVIEAFKRVGMSADVEFLPWNRVLSMAKKGTTVAALSCAKSESRDHFFNYSDPISQSTNAFVASTDFKGTDPKHLIDAKGYRIIAVRGYVNELDLKKEKLEYQYAMNDLAALNLLLKRDFDFFYTTIEFIKYVAVDLNVADQLQYFDMQLSKNYHLCFSRHWPNSEALLAKFNSGLAQVRADG
ncbi:MAG: transporter substrate-binding domain-containing protein, partial [Sneathiella sp.]